MEAEMSFTGSTMGKYSRFWLIITGAILLAVGVVMAVALGGLPFAGTGMLLTGGILGIVGLALIAIGIVVGRRAADVDRVLATGIAGTAQVTGVTQTGMYLNEQPQLELNLLVNLPGRPPYAATHRSFVPLMLMSRVTSGMPLAVMVDQTDPQKIVVDWKSSGFGVPMQPMGQPMQPIGQPMQPMGQPVQPAGQASSAGTGIDESLNQVQAALASSGTATPPPFASPEQGNYTIEQLRAYLRSSGVQSSARIDSLSDTGQIVGDERLYKMQVTVELPGGPRQLPESAAMVPLTAMHKVRVGATVPVRYAAENPNMMMFEWERI
jgi:hypothetical protein